MKPGTKQMQTEDGIIILGNILKIYLMMKINLILSSHAQMFIREIKAYIHIHLVQQSDRETVEMTPVSISR